MYDSIYMDCPEKAILESRLTVAWGIVRGGRWGLIMKMRDLIGADRNVLSAFRFMVMLTQLGKFTENHCPLEMRTIRKRAGLAGDRPFGSET